MALKIKPNKLSGEVILPPSKSLAHRAIICASLAKGSSKLYNIDYSEDIKATINCMQQLGTYIEVRDDYLFIDGMTSFFRNYLDFYVGESGSTLRFMIPLSLVYQSNARFRGASRLAQRSLTPYYNIFEKQKLNFLYKQDALDVMVEGCLMPDTFEVPGDVSSQFISGLLFACPLMRGDSKIVITSSLQSKGYVDLTLQMLKMYGIEIQNNNYEEFVIKGNQSYLPLDYNVEKDYSQAAFYLVANKLGSNIQLEGLNPHSYQGDKIILEILENLDEVDASNCPDLIPVVALACALTKGKHVIKNCERLKIKECDRLDVTCEVLSKLGANITHDGHNMYIEGVEKLHGASISTYNDHRIAMMIAIASTVCDGEIEIDNFECVKKSYPAFWDDFKKIKGEVYEC